MGPQTKTEGGTCILGWRRGLEQEAGPGAGGGRQDLKFKLKELPAVAAGGGA